MRESSPVGRRLRLPVFSAAVSRTPTLRPPPGGTLVASSEAPLERRVRPRRPAGPEMMSQPGCYLKLAPNPRQVELAGAEALGEISAFLISSSPARSRTTQALNAARNNQLGSDSTPDHPRRRGAAEQADYMLEARTQAEHPATGRILLPTRTVVLAPAVGKTSSPPSLPKEREIRTVPFYETSQPSRYKQWDPFTLYAACARCDSAQRELRVHAPHKDTGAEEAGKPEEAGKARRKARKGCSLDSAESARWNPCP